jgi:hypothetical protein
VAAILRLLYLWANGLSERCQTKVCILKKHQIEHCKGSIEEPITMSAYSNGSNTSRGSSLSHGSSVSRWKLDEQKRRLRECRRRASGCVQEIKIMKEECTLLSAAITEQERTQQSLQEQRDKLQTSTTGESPSQSCTISQVGIFEEMQSSVSVCW